MDIETTEAGPSRPWRSSQPTTPRQTSPEQASAVTSYGDDGSQDSNTSRREPSRPASPETAFASRRPGGSRPETPPADDPPGVGPAVCPHIDLASYPTSTLLRLIANLLQQIAGANDQIRSDPNEMEEDNSGAADQSQSSRSGSRASSTGPQSQPSPKTALFNEVDTTTDRLHGSQPPIQGGIDPSSPLPLFTASRTSLVHPSSLLSFHARHVPSISIEAYLLRILKYCPTTNEVFLSLLVYFDRMSRLGTASGVGAGLVLRNGKGFAIDSYNVHRLVIAGVTVASKFFSDVFYTNSRYAKVGGLPPHELNQLELQFLLLNDFRLAVPTQEMQSYGDRLLAYWQGREEETGVDVETGRELSESGKRRLQERKEREHTEKVTKALQEGEGAARRSANGQNGRIKSSPLPTEEDALRAQDALRHPTADGMEVDPTPASAQPVSVARPVDPAQPPPDIETASAPATPQDDGGPVDVREEARHQLGNQDAPIPQSAPTPFISGPPASTPDPVAVISVQDSATPPISPAPAVKNAAVTAAQTPSTTPAVAAPPPLTSATNGSRPREHPGSFSSHQQPNGSFSGQRSSSFSRQANAASTDGGASGMGVGWEKGDRSVVVSGIS